MDSESEELTCNFYTKSSEDNKTIEIVDNCEINNSYKQSVCLPYFKNIYIVKHIMTTRI